MGLKIEDDLPKVKWAEYARLKNKIDPREVVPALPNKYFPIVVRAASRDELDDIPRDLYTVTVLLKDELKGKVFEVNFQVHPVPPKVPDGKFLRLAFLEIGYAFQHSGYFTELKELRDTMKSFKLLDDPPEKYKFIKNYNAVTFFGCNSIVIRFL